MTSLETMSPSTVPRPNKRRELGAKSRDEILNAALSMMSLFGYEGASVSKIATESGLPASSIYWHFGSKAGVLAAVLERSAQDFFRDSDPDLKPSEEVIDPLSTLRGALAKAQRTASEHPEFLRLLFLLSLSGEHDEKVTTVIEEVTRQGREQLRDLLRFAFSGEGELMAARIADELVDFAQATFDGLSLNAQTRPHVSPALMIDRMAEALYGLGNAIIRREG